MLFSCLICMCIETFWLFMMYMGCRDCSIEISKLRGGQRHGKWVSLQNIKMGRLHLAITVLEDELDKVRLL